MRVPREEEEEDIPPGLAYQVPTSKAYTYVHMYVCKPPRTSHPWNGSCSWEEIKQREGVLVAEMEYMPSCRRLDSQDKRAARLTLGDDVMIQVPTCITDILWYACQKLHIARDGT